jgi:microcystin-dependent protein
MGQEYIGEVRLVGFNFAPAGWSTCGGQLLPISEYSTLFNLIGTTYGGDGQQTFALPNLQSRIPVHMGTGTTGTTYVIGATGGTETVTVNINQYPAHSHNVLASSQTTGGSTDPTGKILGGGQTIYRNQTPAASMNAGMLTSDGGSQPHENLQPFLVLNWVISLFGVYPSQS